MFARLRRACDSDGSLTTGGLTAGRNRRRCGGHSISPRCLPLCVASPSTLAHQYHVRSFLGHNRPYLPPAHHPFGSRQIRTTGAFAYLGGGIPPDELEENLVRHLRRWAPYVGRFGFFTGSACPARTCVLGVCLGLVWSANCPPGAADGAGADGPRRGRATGVGLTYPFEAWRVMAVKPVLNG